MGFSHTLEEDDTWDRFYHPDADDEDPPTMDEVRILREFVDRYGTPRAIAVNEAARNFMSLCNDDRHGGIVDKGERVGWLLWDVGIEMPQYQPAILKLVEAIRALPGIDRTEEQISVWRFKERLERWRDMEAFDEIWFTAYERYWEQKYTGDAFTEEAYSGFVNANTFNALHLVAYPPDPSCSSHELARAFRLISFTLEQDPWNHLPSWLQETNTSRRVSDRTWYITSLNANVHALVPFIQIAGHIIFRFVNKKDLAWLESVKSKYPDSDLWKGSTMFTLDRWEFWRERLRWISEQNDLKERTRDEAQMLENLMQNIQQYSKGSATA